VTRDRAGNIFTSAIRTVTVDNTAPAVPTHAISESSPDSHASASTFFYRPGGAGGVSP
jgi:hypothetical protein